MVIGQSDGPVSAKEIVQKADEKVRGKTSESEITMTIVRPTWERAMGLKSWSKGDELAVILVTSPARDKGVAFLKRNKELWNWQPAINRIIKMPPSMMMQSWMGSDFTNDDLVKESSIIEDYTHTFLKDDVVADRSCYVIEMVPKPDAPIVWGRVICWIDKTDYIQMKTEMYDEEGFLVNTMIAFDIEMLGGKMLPKRVEMIPADEEGHMTVIEYVNLKFDVPLDDSFFSSRNLKRVR